MDSVIIVVFICISWITNDLGLLFTCLFSLIYLLWLSAWWNLCLFLIVLFVLLSLSNVLYIFWRQVLYQIDNWEIYSLSLWLVLLLFRSVFLSTTSFNLDRNPAYQFVLLWILLLVLHLRKCYLTQGNKFLSLCSLLEIL